jgi:hypothetical protein
MQACVAAIRVALVGAGPVIFVARVTPPLSWRATRGSASHPLRGTIRRELDGRAVSPSMHWALPRLGGMPDMRGNDSPQQLDLRQLDAYRGAGGRGGGPGRGTPRRPRRVTRGHSGGRRGASMGFQCAQGLKGPQILSASFARGHCGGRPGRDQCPLGRCTIPRLAGARHTRPVGVRRWCMSNPDRPRNTRPQARQP